MTERSQQLARSAVAGQTTAPGVALPARANRPRFRLSDLWDAPLHDLPVRNEILYENAEVGGGMDVLEVGPGSGLAAFLLAREARSFTALDYAPRNIEDLSRKLGSIRNLHFACADIGDASVGSRMSAQFDLAFALDVLEYVATPKAFFQNLGAMLRHGGRMVVTFPNMPDQEGDGVTWFNTLGELEQTVAEGGFSRVDLYSIVLNERGERLYQLFHEAPLRLVRRLRRPVGEGNPQVYEQTWAFQKRGLLTLLRPALNVYWAAVMAGVRRSNPVFQRMKLAEPVLRKQILVVAQR